MYVRNMYSSLLLTDSIKSRAVACFVAIKSLGQRPIKGFVLIIQIDTDQTAPECRCPERTLSLSQSVHLAQYFFHLLSLSFFFLSANIHCLTKENNSKLTMCYTPPPFCRRVEGKNLGKNRNVVYKYC